MRRAKQSPTASGCRLRSETTLCGNLAIRCSNTVSRRFSRRRRRCRPTRRLPARIPTDRRLGSYPPDGMAADGAPLPSAHRLISTSNRAWGASLGTAAYRRRAEPKVERCRNRSPWRASPRMGHPAFLRE